MTQDQLATKMGTRQPAVARIEAGTANVRLSTLVQLAEALDATIRIDLEPCEMLRVSSPAQRWWEQGDKLLLGADLAETQHLDLKAVSLPSSGEESAALDYRVYPVVASPPAVQQVWEGFASESDMVTVRSVGGLLQIGPAVGQR